MKRPHPLIIVLMCLPAVCPAWAAPADEAQKKAEAARLKQQEVLEHRAAGRNESAGMAEKEAARLRDDAQRLFEAAGAETSADSALVLAYAAFLSERGDHDLAAKQYARIAARSQQPAEIWRRAGAAYLKAGPGLRQDALAALKASLAADATTKDAAMTHFHLGDLYQREGLFEIADEEYAAALRLDPACVPALLGKAVLDARKGKIADASQAMDALGRDAQPYDAWTRTRLREALENYEHRRDFFEDTPRNNLAYARLLYRAARLPDAILAARRAVKLAPSDFDTWNFIGAMQSQLGSLKQAAEAYEKSLEINAEQPQVKAVLEEIKAAMRQQQ
jgi:tetratricopeptide (TPR) repeat protein